MATEVSRKHIKVTELGPVAIITKQSLTDDGQPILTHEVRQGGRTVGVKDSLAAAEALARAL